MVSFTCETCQEVLKKNAVAKHFTLRCRAATHFSCIDCCKIFDRQSIVSHTTCTTEEEKYHGQFARKNKQGSAGRKLGSHGRNASGAIVYPVGETSDSQSGKSMRKKLSDTGKYVSRAKLDANAEEAPGGAEKQFEWQGDWVATVRHILSKIPQRSLEWNSLAEKAVQAYLASVDGASGRHEADDLINVCLASIPDEYVNEEDEFVRLPPLRK